jgi:hypothetical protein
MSDSTKPVHGLDPALISAYYDDALDNTDRRLVEAHLARCPTCREQLAAYATLGGGVRAGVDPSVPASVDARVAKLLKRGTTIRRAAARAVKPAPRRPAVGSWAVRSSLAVAVLAVLLVGTVVLGLPLLGGVGGPAVASAYPCSDPAECAIAVRFSAPVDHAAVERSVQIDPPVPVTFAWQGDTVFIKPKKPLQASASYTVRLQPNAGSRILIAPFASKATPVALQFVASSAGAPVVMASNQHPASVAAPTSTAVTLVQATASPPSAQLTATPSPPAVTSMAVAAVRSATSTACTVQPVRGFGTLYHNQPKVASRLGCARAPEAGVDMFVEPFEHGRMLWRGDRRVIFALTSDGHWSSYPDTFNGTETVTPAPGEPIRGFGKVWRENPTLRAAIGAATAPEQPIGGAVEEFEHGLLVWTADRTIYVLYSDGTWEQYADTFVDATATAAAVASASPAAVATPTTSPVPSPASTPPVATPSPSGSSPSPAPTSVSSGGAVAVSCSLQPVRGFGLVYSTNPDVATRLGCASAPEIGSQSTRQTFEHGVMIRRDDVRQIFVIKGDGTWAVYSDTYQAGETSPDVGVAPSGRFAPVDGFGKLWREQPGLRQALGWATGPAQDVSGAYEDFAAGRMVWTSDRTIYALFSDGTWRSFVDQFVDPTATPAPR